MKRLSLSEAEVVLLGTRFSYVSPDKWCQEEASNWRLLDRNLAEGEALMLEELHEKKLVWHWTKEDWPAFAGEFSKDNESCWVYTDAGLAIADWFHSFPENYGL